MCSHRFTHSSISPALSFAFCPHSRQLTNSSHLSVQKALLLKPLPVFPRLRKPRPLQVQTQLFRAYLAPAVVGTAVSCTLRDCCQHLSKLPAPAVGSVGVVCAAPLRVDLVESEGPQTFQRLHCTCFQVSGSQVSVPLAFFPGDLPGTVFLCHPFSLFTKACSVPFSIKSQSDCGVWPARKEGTSRITAQGSLKCR